MSSLLESLTIACASNAGTPDTFYEIADDIGLENGEPDVALAGGFSRKRGSLKRLTARILEADAYSRLEAGMLARATSTITLNLLQTAGEPTDPVFSNMLYTVTPIISNLPDQASLYVTAAGTATPATGATPGVGFTSLGRLVGQSQPDLNIEMVDDGVGLPLYSYVTLNQSFEGTANDSVTYDALKTLERARAKIKVIVGHPDGTWRAYTNVYIEARDNPNPGGKSIQSLGIRIYGAAAKFSDFITLPGSAEDHYHGALLTAVGFGYEEEDVMTRPV